MITEHHKMYQLTGYAKTCLVICLLVCIQVCSGLRILGLVPFQGNSHFNMCKGLLRALAERGHQVDVYSQFPSKKPIPNYTDYSLAGTVYELRNNMSYDFIKDNMGGTFSPKTTIDRTMPICELMSFPIFQKLLKNPPNDPPYDLIIVQVFLINCYLAWGRHLNVPMIGVVSVPALEWLDSPLGNPSNLAVQPSIFTEYQTPMTFMERVKNVVLTNYITHSFNYYIREHDAIIEKYFGPGYPNAVELQKDLSLVFVNYHPALNGIKAFTPAVVPVGGIHISDTGEQLTKEVQQFLDESKDGFIYISFGSMVRIETFPKPVLEAFYQTFEKIKPVRVLMKIAKPEELPLGLPSNVITHNWLPQVTVLKHKNVKLFITHGGLLSTQESIYFGVPMIGFPLFGDQHLNMGAYVNKNFAIQLDYSDVTGPILTEAVTKILENPIYKNSVKKASQLFQDSPMSPKDNAVFWVEYIARHGKDALRSPLVDMPWWQACLLDVYGLIIFNILLVLYIVKVTFKKLFTLFLQKKDAQSKSKVKKN